MLLMPDKLLLIEMTNGDFRVGGQYGSVRKLSRAFKTRAEAEFNGRLIRNQLRICKKSPWVA